MTDVYISNGPIFTSGKATRKCATVRQFPDAVSSLNSREKSIKRWHLLKKIEAPFGKIAAPFEKIAPLFFRKVPLNFAKQVVLLQTVAFMLIFRIAI